MSSMIPNKKSVAVYAGRWGNNDYVFALSSEAARNLVQSHFAYGELGTDEYVLGTKWAEYPDDDGWRIVKLTLRIEEIPVLLKINNHGSTPHVIWTCPICNRNFSDDWIVGQKFPILLACGCRDESQFFLGVDSR